MYHVKSTREILQKNFIWQEQFQCVREFLKPYYSLLIFGTGTVHQALLPLNFSGKLLKFLSQFWINEQNQLIK